MDGAGAGDSRRIPEPEQGRDDTRSNAHLEPATPDGLDASSELVVVSWNTHVGGGLLDQLIADLSAGTLTGSPVTHFVRLVRRHLPRPVVPPDGGTHELPILAIEPRLDHLFFRLPPVLEVGYEVAPDRYGSDHNPLAGRIAPAAVAQRD